MFVALSLHLASQTWLRAKMRQVETSLRRINVDDVETLGVKAHCMTPMTPKFGLCASLCNLATFKTFPSFDVPLFVSGL